MGILQQIIPLIIQYQLQKRKEQEQNLAAYAGQEGWGGAEKQFGTKKVLDLYQSMFGKGAMPPQRTLQEVSGAEGVPYEPEMQAHRVEPQLRTERKWPQPTSAQITERGTKEYLTQPGKLQQFISGQMGEGTLFQKAQAEAQKRQAILAGVKSLITSKANVRSPDGTDRPITGPEARAYVTNIIEGVEPSIEVTPPKTEADKWQFALSLTDALTQLNIYGKKLSDLPAGHVSLVRQAEAVGAAQVSRENTVMSPTAKEVPIGPPTSITTPHPTKPDIDIVTLYDKSGNVLQTGERPRWKDESAAARSFTQKQFGDEVDLYLSEIFYEAASKEYNKALGISPEEAKKREALRDLMITMGGKDPMNAPRRYATTVYQYLPPEQKKRFDRIREEASRKWTSGEVQYVPSIIREILESEYSKTAPIPEAFTMKRFIEEKRKEFSQSEIEPKAKPTKSIGQRAVELSDIYKGDMSSIRRTLTSEFGEEAFRKWIEEGRVVK